MLRRVGDRVVRVLALLSGLAVAQRGRRGPAHELRTPRIFQVPDVDHRDAAEARLAGARIEQTGALRPPSFVRATDERTAAAGTAVAGRRARDLGHERDLRRAGVAPRDVEDPALE